MGSIWAGGARISKTVSKNKRVVCDIDGRRGYHQNMAIVFVYVWVWCEIWQGLLQANLAHRVLLHQFILWFRYHSKANTAMPKKRWISSKNHHDLAFHQSTAVSLTHTLSTRPLTHVICALESHIRHIQIKVQHIIIKQIDRRPAMHPINPHRRIRPRPNGIHSSSHRTASMV